MKKNIIKEVLKANYIKDLHNVTSDISTLSDLQLEKGLNGFYNAYNDYPNLFDCGDVDSILYFSNL